MRQGSTVITALFATGLVLGALTPVAHAGEPLDDRLGIRTAPILLLFRSDVQADLKLTPGQISESRREAIALYDKAQKLSARGKSGAGVVAARRIVDDEQSEWLNKNLTADQLNRLGQIDLQWEGAAAMLSRPMLAEYLSLTPDQRDRLARLVAASGQQRTQSAWTYSHHLNLTHQAISVLSDKQYDLWVLLVGTPLRFTIAGGAPAHAAEAAPSGQPRAER
jgi:hypothetical protein